MAGQGCVAEAVLCTVPRPGRVWLAPGFDHACGPLEVGDLVVRLCHDLAIDEGGLVGIANWGLRRLLRLVRRLVGGLAPWRRAGTTSSDQKGRIRSEVRRQSPACSLCGMPLSQECMEIGFGGLVRHRFKLW